jgi:hypothetical protein
MCAQPPAPCARAADRRHAGLDPGFVDEHQAAGVKMGPDELPAVAPPYDAVTTGVFPRLARDRMALKFNGKDDRLHRADFQAIAATAGLKAADADTTIDEPLSALALKLDDLGPCRR